MEFKLRECHTSEGLYSRLIYFGEPYELWFDSIFQHMYVIFEDRSMVIWLYTNHDYFDFFRVAVYTDWGAESNWPVYGYNIVVKKCIDVTSKFVYHFGKPEFLDNIAIWRGGTWGSKKAD